MTFFAWEDRYDVGVDTMNRQHQELMRLMNKLHELHTQSAPKVQIAAQLDALGKYTHRHFAEEEQFMQSIGYADLAKHRLIHKDLLDRLAGHVAEFKTDGRLKSAFFSFLKMWLAAHICGIDKKYSPARLPRSA